MKSKTEGIVVLGATGSIGESTLSVIENNPNRYRVDGLSCNGNIERLAEQIRQFSPRVVAVGENKGQHLKELLGKTTRLPEIFEGKEGFIRLATYPSADKVVAAFVGAAGIEPAMAAIKAGKTLALANKESMVLAGELLLAEAKHRQVRILPVDSEHNAIFQSLNGERRSDVDHITLTASGGPFRQLDPADFKNVTLEDALNHPNWSMGQKITIDSATMINKCLEIIEARWLFDIPPEQIKVLIHPQSIVHSMVTYKDGSTICQMGVPDMRIPIANCLGYPERIESGSAFLDLATVGNLTFERPDGVRFPSIQMAYDVLKLGGGAPAALNGANEILVERFIKREILFMQIFSLLDILIKHVKQRFYTNQFSGLRFLKNVDTLSDAIAADQWGREFIEDQLK